MPSYEQLYDPAESFNVESYLSLESVYYGIITLFFCGLDSVVFYTLLKSSINFVFASSESLADKF